MKFTLDDAVTVVFILAVAAVSSLAIVLAVLTLIDASGACK